VLAASGAPASAATTPELTTLSYAATGAGGALYKPVGVSAANGTVYVSDTGANVIAAITGGTTSAFAGELTAYGEHGDGGTATSASLYHPGGTAENAAGDVFIADSGDNTIREVTPSGTITRFAGSGIAGLGYAGPSAYPADLSSLDHPQDVAVNAAGDVYIADTYNNRVVKVTPAGQLTVVAGDGKAGYSGDGHLAAFAELDQPAGIAIDSQGNLYIADSANNVIRRVDAKTGIITTVAGDYAADKADGGLGGFSGNGGPATSAQLNDPQGIAIDGAGDLFIADTFNNAIREVTPAGIISTVVNEASAGGGAPAAGSESSGKAPTASKLDTPYDVAIDPSTEDLYIADTSNSEIAEVTGLAQPGDAAGPVAPAAS
jgi:sugar lactone lactonase YvrE